MVKLAFISPDFEGQSCVLPEGKTTVGRASANLLVIQHKSVSGDHGEILVHGAEVIVRDCGSSNGSWIDGVKIQGQLSAHHGQQIRFGAVEARLEIQMLPLADENSEISAVHSHARAVREATLAKNPPPTSGTPAIIKMNPAKGGSSGSAD